MRSIWKGTISFGLVSVPVQLFSATQQHRVPLHQVHARDGARIRMRRFCEAEGEEVPYEEIAKGYQSPDGRTVVLSDEDLAELPLPSKKMIDVLAFVNEDDIDPVMLSDSYYVGTADRAALKPYVLLREALKEAGQLAVTKVTLRTRESLAVLRAHEDVLVLQTMLWPDEIRSAGDAVPEGDAGVRPQELRMARSLMDTLSEGFDLAELHDEYSEALRQVVEARLQGVEPPREGAPAAPEENVIDLMAALRGSVKAAREGRAGGRGGRAAGGGGAAGEEAAPKEAPAEEAAPEKTAQSRPARKRAAPKKTAAKASGGAKASGRGRAKAAGAEEAGAGEKKTATGRAKKTASRRRAS